MHGGSLESTREALELFEARWSAVDMQNSGQPTGSMKRVNKKINEKNE